MYKIVFAYDEKIDELPNLVGKTVSSYIAAIDLLKAGQTVVLQIGSGAWKGWFKNVWKDEEGVGWIQKRCSPEY